MNSQLRLIIIKLILISLIKSNELLITIINKNDNLVLSEHVFKNIGMNIFLKGLSLKTDDEFEIKIKQFNVQRQQQEKELQGQTVFKGNNQQPSYNSIIESQTGEGQYIIIEIINTGQNDMEIQIQIKDHVNSIDNENSHLIEGVVKSQSLDYLQHLVEHMSTVMSQIRKYKDEQIENEDREMSNMEDIGYGVKYFGHLSVIAIVLMAVIIIICQGIIMRRKKQL